MVSEELKKQVTYKTVEFNGKSYTIPVASDFKKLNVGLSRKAMKLEREIGKEAAAAELVFLIFETYLEEEELDNLYSLSNEDLGQVMALANGLDPEGDSEKKS